MVTKKVAVVTGGARGIGLAAVEIFLAKGYDVAVVDMSYTVANELAETYSGVLPIECDVSNPDDVSAMAAVIERQYGRVDALVNNAGIAALHPIEETGFDSWKKNHVGEPGRHLSCHAGPYAADEKGIRSDC